MIETPSNIGANPVDLTKIAFFYGELEKQKATILITLLKAFEFCGGLIRPVERKTLLEKFIGLGGTRDNFSSALGNLKKILAEYDLTIENNQVVPKGQSANTAVVARGGVVTTQTDGLTGDQRSNHVVTRLTVEKKPTIMELFQLPYTGLQIEKDRIGEFITEITAFEKKAFDIAQSQKQWQSKIVSLKYLLTETYLLMGHRRMSPETNRQDWPKHAYAFGLLEKIVGKLFEETEREQMGFTGETGKVMTTAKIVSGLVMGFESALNGASQDQLRIEYLKVTEDAIPNNRKNLIAITNSTTKETLCFIDVQIANPRAGQSNLVSVTEGVSSLPLIDRRQDLKQIQLTINPRESGDIGFNILNGMPSAGLVQYLRDILFKK